MIIGIAGLIGSGKGTVADILVEQHNFTKISFADKLKDGVAASFGWDRELLEGDTAESRKWRETPDEFWTKETGSEVTPRLVLQKFGTDCMRNGFFDGIWVSLVKQEILNNPDTNYIVPDVRFKNEIDAINDMGGKIWNVRRGELPEWWETAVTTNATPDDKEWIIYDEGNHMEVAYPDIHVSEWAWIDKDETFGNILHNDDSIESLYSQVSTTLST